MAIEFSEQTKAVLVKAIVFISVIVGGEYGAAFYAEKYYSGLEQENRVLEDELSEVKSQLARIVDEERQQQLVCREVLGV